MITLINYADSKFAKKRKINSFTSRLIGKVDRLIEFSPEDIDEQFKKKHSNIFDYKRGAGLWLWKPYIINKSLEMINNGDFLFYTDSGSFFVNRVSHLTTIMERDNIDLMFFELPLLDRQFTKKETFINLDFNDYSSNQILGGYILLRKSEISISFIKEWLDAASEEVNLSPNKFNFDILENEDFITHREDQSVLSILCHKKGIKPYRDPSQFGIRPWEYSKVGRILVFNSYKESTYPQILIANRGMNPFLTLFSEVFKSLSRPILKVGLEYKCNE